MPCSERCLSSRTPATLIDAAIGGTGMPGLFSSELSVSIQEGQERQEGQGGKGQRGVSERENTTTTKTTMILNQIMA